MGKKKIKIDNKHINRNNLDFKKVNDKVNANFFSSTNRNLQRLILFLLSFIIYSATINFDFTLDDTLMITQNSYTKQGIKGIKEIMTNDALVGFLGKGKNLLPGGRYRPLSHVLFAVEYELLGLSKLEKVSNLTNEQKIFKEKREKLMKIIGHSVNVILYSLLSLLIFSVLLRMFKLYEKPQWYASISFIATLLFIVHPLHTEVVCNIKNVDEIMSMLGSMSVLWFLFKYYDTKKNWLLVFPIIIYPLAILSKEDSLTFIAIFPLTSFVFTNVDFKQHLKNIPP